MTTADKPHRLAAALAAFTATLALVGGVGMVFADAGPQTPAALQPQGQRPVLLLAARGVQIYECRAGAQAPAWAFVAPQAQLFDAQGALVGTHGAGPFWQDGDGSRIVGRVLARAEAPSAADIPWLLLAATSSGTPGRLAPVSSVQRIHTAGGQAPAHGCDATTLGTTVRIPYSADYRFFVQG